jgi:hypothetical protein
MNYTDEQRAILAQYEPYLRTAARSDWARNPGPRALEQINDILYAGKPHKPRVNYGCQQCILSILRDAGRAYFADLEELAAKPEKPKTASPKEAENKAAKPAGGKTPGRTRKAAKTEK